MRLLSLICFYLPFCLYAQNRTISGYLSDAETGEKLIAANIFDERSAQGTVTNNFGFYSLTLPIDSVHLVYSYIGYQSERRALDLRENQSLDISLSSSIELATVEVIAEKVERIEEKTQMSQVSIPIQQIKKVPALLGEVDVLKAIQLLPGVQSGGEGQSGIYVRGGSPDQNLILLDGVPIYNVSHVLGIFSVFNADAIKNVTLTKGGFPARFGGRLSSVLEINMKDGNNKKFQGEGSIGNISSKLTLEGPIISDKTSFIVSGRRTYADIVAKPFIAAANKNADTQVKPVLYFYDLNAKLNHTFNDKHRLYVSSYLGSDRFLARVSEDDSAFEGGLDWGNLISSLRWNHKISNKLFANTTVTYSKYDLDISAAIEERGFTPTNESTSFSSKYVSGIEDLGIKYDLDYVPNTKHFFKMGLQATRHIYSPGALTIEAKFGENVDNDISRELGTQDQTSYEYGVYIEDDIHLGNLRMNVGLHASAFAVDKTKYYSVQPRLGVNYKLSSTSSLKASYSQMRQYINLLTSEALSLPTDLWVPSTADVLPQESWQVALGYAKTWRGTYEFSLEGYYKKMQNVISFLPGASFLFGFENDWQTKITQGEGEAYGAEVFLQKKTGKTTGWIGYTLSWNNRQFDEINGGKSFPFRYDRRHDLSVVANHDFSKRISISGAWIFGTGNAVTLPIYSYPVSLQNVGTDGQIDYTRGYDIESLGTKNDFRMSNYHRLDLSISFHKKKKWGERSWIISIYNTYWHKNPYFIIADQTPKRNTNGQVIGSQRVFKEISILPIIPSLSYRFKF